MKNNQIDNLKFSPLYNSLNNVKKSDSINLKHSHLSRLYEGI
jgi:hypothetical protein